MLRDYQLDICARVREAFEKHRSVMVQMPTGTGKTMVLAELVIKELKDEKIKGRSGRILIVAHRRELIEQIKATVKRMVEPQPPNGEIVIESIQTISRRMGNSPTGGQGSFSLVIVDEAHHALAKTYKMMWEEWPEAKFLGLTATPCRLNGKGFTDLFDVLLTSLTVPQFMQKGVLAPFDYVTINKGSRQKMLVDSLKKRGADGDYQVKEMNEVLNKRPSIEQLFRCYNLFAKKKKGIVYAVSIDHARSIAEYYESQGVRAAAIDSHTPAKVREELLERWDNRGAGGTGLQVLVNVDIFSEGFDCPDVEFIQLARPTLSLAKYLQMVGRGLRPHKNKECCVILDNVGLLHLFGLPTRCWKWEAAFSGLKNERIKELKFYQQSITNNLQSITNNQQSITNNQQIEEFSLVVSHEQLEQMIRDSKLEDVLDGTSYLRVFNIKDGLASVRLRDTKLAIVDMAGNIVRKLGKGASAELYNKDFAIVYDNNRKEYVDLLNGLRYEALPKVVEKDGLQLLMVDLKGLVLRLKDPFMYGEIREGNYYAPRDWGYFYEVHLSKGRGDVECYAVDTNTMIVFKGDNERAYWLYDVHEDGSVEVIDRMNNCYHVYPDGKKEKLNRFAILEQSVVKLKEIDKMYRAKGGNLDDGFERMWFRNRVVSEGLEEKIKTFIVKGGFLDDNGDN